MKLSQSNILTVGDTGKDQRLFDLKVPGLFLRISKNGNRSYAVRKNENGNIREKTLGNAKILTLDQARKIAREKIAMPSLDEKQEPLFCQVIEEYMMYVESSGNRRSTIRHKQSLLKIYIVPKFGNFRIIDITRGKIQKLLEEILRDGKGQTANAVRTLLQTIFEYAISHEYIASNPASKTKKVAPVKVRDRVLSDEEIGYLLRDLLSVSSKISLDTRDCILLMMLTGARSTEVTEMQWRELDFKKKVWNLPAARNKSKRDHTIPLSRLALLVLEKRGGNMTGRVFDIAEKTPTQWLKRLSKAKMSKTKGYQGSIYSHALRKTLATKLAEKFSMPDSNIERVLNHSTNKSGSLHHYNMHDYFCEKRDALEEWSTYLEKNYSQLKIFNND